MSISDFIEHPNIYFWIYTASITIAFVALSIRTRKKNHRYIYWKKETFNIGIYKREYEQTSDDVLQQLWEENQLLEKKVKLLESDFKNYKMGMIGFLIVLIIVIAYNSIKSKLFPNKKQDVVDEKENPPVDINDRTEPGGFTGL